MTRSLATRIGAVLLAAGLGLAACGSDDGDSTATSATSAAGTTVPASAASEAPSASGTRTVPTAYGDVEIPTDPQRVVAASYDTPWQLMAVGVVPVGVQDYARWIDSFAQDQQDFIAGIPTIGSFGELNFEAIAAAQPDLIVGDAYEIDQATYEQLAAIAPTAIVEGDSRGDWKAISSAIADAAGAGDALAEAIETYDAELARITAAYPDALALPWVHVSLGDTEGEFSIQYTTGITGSIIFDELGATLAPSVPDVTPDYGYASYSLEAMGDLLADAEVVIHFLNADGSDNPLIAAVLASPFFDPPAKAAGQVFGITASVTDYVTATQYIQEIESTVLQHLG
jgi:iron complex transport system substrate-binding protein